MKFEIYCDESRQDLFGKPPEEVTGQFALIGGIWIEAASRPEIKDRIRSLRDKHNLHGEFKWNRVTPSKGDFYRDLVDLFFSIDEMRFRCLVLPADRMNAIQFSDGDNELMFYKFYYQLIHHWILDDNEYRIFMDAKTNRVRQRLPTLKNVLSNANKLAVIQDVQALPSHKVDLIQLADVLMGAVGYHFHCSSTSMAKKSVIEAIENRLGHQISRTARTVQKFNIFKWHPGGGW